MEKIWYVYIDGKKEGPYSVAELKRHPKVTPDTLGWKEGFKQWVPLRSIFELADVFEDEESYAIDEQESLDQSKKQKPKIDTDTVAIRYEPPASFFWIFIAILIIAYTLYVIYKGQH